MSILDFPRVYFRGEIAWDPVTTNNYSVDNTRGALAAYNEDATLSTNKSAPVTQAPAAENVAKFRKAAVDEISTSGSWNPHGSYRCPFFNTTVSGIDAGRGLDRSDPFVKAPISFSGMLIDAEPYGAFSSQMFFDDISFGIAGGCRVFAKRVMRINDRFINFYANPSNNMIAGVASVMWQTCFSKTDGLVIDAHDSTVLNSLTEALRDEEVAGLMLRFNTYRTVYYDDPTLFNGPTGGGLAKAQELQRKIQAGGFQPNPARSILVGTLGLWRRSEVPTEACERALVSTMSAITGYPPPDPNAQNPGPAVGTAFAKVVGQGLCIDLSNAIPCADRAAEKIDIGELTVVASDPLSPAVVEIAKIPFSRYNREAYEATSGIIDIPLAANLARQIANSDLSLRGPDGVTYLAEAALRAVPLVPNLYADQGEPTKATAQVYLRGAPAGAGVPVTFSKMGDAQYTRSETGADGRVNFDLPTGEGAVTGWIFQPGPNPILPITDDNFNPLVQTYMYLRVLPNDPVIARYPATWENVYTYVLSNWDAMAPCMDNWLVLNDEAQVRRYGPLIYKLTHPSNFEAFRYMPPTRDLTRGRRALLYRFLGFDFDPVESAPPLSLADASSDPGLATGIFALSRSMRGG